MVMKSVMAYVYTQRAKRGVGFTEGIGHNTPAEATRGGLSEGKKKTLFDEG